VPDKFRPLTKNLNDWKREGYTYGYVPRCSKQKIELSDSSPCWNSRIKDYTHGAFPIGVNQKLNSQLHLPAETQKKIRKHYTDREHFSSKQVKCQIYRFIFLLKL